MERSNKRALVRAAEKYNFVLLGFGGFKKYKKYKLETTFLTTKI
jgi:hypothetical protein